MNFIVKYKLIILSILAGAIGGYVYYCTVGCITGTCAITSDPANSTLYGAMMGGLIFNVFRTEKKNTNT
jgi:phage shock protein E